MKRRTKLRFLQKINGIYVEAFDHLRPVQKMSRFVTRVLFHVRVSPKAEEIRVNTSKTKAQIKWTGH